MLRTAGGLLLGIAVAAVGFAARRRLAERVNLLQTLAAALDYFDRELAFRLAPMPELLARAAAQSPPPASGFFQTCLNGVERGGDLPFADVWRTAAAEALPTLTVPQRQSLDVLGGVLGRYDADGQRAAIAHTRAELTEHIAAAASERDRLSRVYSALGLSAGGLLFILIL